MIPYWQMQGGVSIPTEIVLAIYSDFAWQAGKGMGMHWKCFGNLPFPTEAWAEVYPCSPKSFQQFILTYQSMSPKVWGCAKSVSVIDCSQWRHARRCIHTHQNCFGNLPQPTETCLQGYGHGLKVFPSFTIYHLPFPTNPCQEVYPYTPKLFWQFTLTYQSMLAKVWVCAENVSVIFHSILRHAQEVYPYPPKLFWTFVVTFHSKTEKVWACTENVSVIYHSLLTHSKRCIYTHWNCFGNLPWPPDACWQRDGGVPKLFW